jgi:hypothetical protein
VFVTVNPTGGVDMTSAVKSGGELIERCVFVHWRSASLLWAAQPAHSTVDHADIRGLVAAVL